MQYSVIGASYQHQSLAVFYAGTDHQALLSYDAAAKKALHLLVAELSAVGLADIHQLTDEVIQFLAQPVHPLARLEDATNDCLSVSWLSDDHFLIAVMDATETYQLHLEVVPVVTGPSSV
ncbi:hypothetical protein [Lacticaseibacillus daqingensis]|uniref:hypothetical protein n=1 Tax=Lacticaseibacillus daqingensis TaxID=2486014 RepID=UPI000F793C7B|nr:hypothetical protein [Lacticaseibacillus daqingensis]